MTNIDFEILNILGLSVDSSTGRIFDVDKGVFLIFNNNYVYTEDSLIIHKGDVAFDIMGNPKLAEYLMNVLLQKESEENGLYAQMILLLEDFNSTPPYTKRALDLKTGTNINIQTQYYYNTCLAYIEMIYLISGIPISIDLHTFDYTIQQLEKMYKGRGK